MSLPLPMDPALLEEWGRSLADMGIGASLVDRRSPSINFAISDDGPGIPPALRQRVLDPFFTTRQTGTGLGLTVCNRIVTDHGGAIHIGESSWGGALVELSLPLAEG